MTNADLIDRLRELAEDSPCYEPACMMDSAADVIETLEREKAELLKACKFMDQFAVWSPSKNSYEILASVYQKYRDFILRLK